jgi:restriction endonuclease S subunit
VNVLTAGEEKIASEGAEKPRGDSDALGLPFSSLPTIPEAPTRAGWQWHLLTDLARLATGHTPSRRCPEYWNGDIPWLQLPDIRALDGRVATNTLERTNQLGIDNSASVLLPAGTVCLSRTASVGFVTVMGCPMATSQDFVNWVCGPDLSPEFLKWLFVACRKPIRDLGSGAVHQTIYFPTVKQFAVCIPPLAEQERIAGRLTEQLAAVERARTAARSRLAAAEALPAAYLYGAFKGAQWPVLELGDGLTRFEAGTSVVALGRPAEEGEWGVLKVSAVSWGQFNARENKAVPAGYLPPAHERVRSGDLIISRANTAELAGAIVLVRDTPNNLMLSDKTLRLVLKQNVFAPEFLELALRSRAARKFIEANATGTSHSMRNISQPTMRAIPVPTPPLATQRRIAVALSRRLTAVEVLAANHRAELAGIEALPASLLREAFCAGGTDE